jgi:hypothetical protein|tara:strand:+ start:3409 stop:3714 length:306 start_codon:yes stop_codon:yes gene_type:complete
LFDYYIGQIGITPNDFWTNTWKENQLLGESYQIKQNLEWERTRYIAMMLFNTNVDKRANMITPDKLFPLPQDVYLERGKPKSTREQYEKFKEKIKKISNKK